MDWSEKTEKLYQAFKTRLLAEIQSQITDKTKGKFVKPTIPEIREYCKAIGSRIDPSTFFNFYESNGWKVGKNPMKNWRAAIRTWNSKEGM